MRALALVLEGPLQSYGASSIGKDRPTEDAPTKSAVVGMVGAALGIERTDVRGLVALDASFALVVRTDQRGEALSDFHTAMDVPWHVGKGQYSYAQLTRRRYLAGARFTALLVEVREGSLDFAALHRAFRYPRYAPVLGRRACSPSAALVERELRVLEGEDWRALLARVPAPSLHEGYEVVVDDALCSEQEKHAGRRLVRRDRVLGPGARMFFDRTAWHLRWSPATASAPEDEGDGSWATGEDTTGGWS